MPNEEKPGLVSESTELAEKQIEAYRVQIESAEKQIVEQSRRIDFYITEYTIAILRTFFEPELETRILPLKSSQVRSLKPAFCRCF